MSQNVDFLRLDDLLSDEEKAVRETARGFVRERVLPIIEQAFRDGRFPTELIPEIAHLGFLGADIHGYGCAGLSQMAYGLLMQELEAGDTGVRSFASVQGGLAMTAIHEFGSEAQKERWLKAMAAGEKIGCFGLTEPDFGSNPGGMRTRATKSSSGFVLDGAKMWITNGTLADVAIVWAKLDGRIRGFLVEKGTPGYTARDIHHKHSLRASVTSELIFESCEIPAENLLPKSDGLKSPLTCLDHARFSIAWGAIGAATTCYTVARDYVLERKQFHDQPLASHQLVQAKLVEMQMEITKAQALTYQATRLRDQGKASHLHTSMIKLNNTEMAIDVARTARAMLGGYGISGEFPIMRHLCNLETVITYEGTSDIHRLILGKAITGLDAF